MTAAAVVLNEFISIALPTYLLRPIGDVNNPAVRIRNRYLLNSTQVSLSNTALAVGVYVVVMFSFLQTGRLTELLIIHFDLPSVQGAYEETPVSLAAKVLAAGVATKAFLLNPSLAATPETGTATPVETFDPATATLPKTIKQNFWFFSRRTRTLIQRTIVLSLALLTNTVQRCWTLEGGDIEGAAGYSGIWIMATVICASWYGWTGDADA